MKTYKLCLVGFGNVGRALVRLLQEKTPDLREKYDIDWCITGVATRRLGWLADPHGLNLAALLAGGFSPDPASPVLHTIREWLMAAQADGLCCKKSGKDAMDVKAHLPVQLRPPLQTGRR